MSVKPGKLRHIILLAFGIAALPVRAADPALPTPGAIGDSLKPATPLRTPQSSTLPGPAPTTTAPAQTSGPKVTVSGFRLSGNTRYSEAQLLPLLKTYIGQALTIAELYQAADRIAAFYQRRGYTLASVVLPPQSVKSGIVQLQVIEGRVGAIRLESKGYKPEGLDGYVRQTRPGEIYRADRLESDLQTLNALPGTSARAVLQPGADAGSSDVIVKTRIDPIETVAEIDNYGRRDVGEIRYSAGVTLNVGLASRLQLFSVHSNTNRLNYAYGAFSMPLDYSGLRLNTDYGFARFSVPQPFGVTGTNKNFDAALEQTLARSATDVAVTAFGYTRTIANADLNGALLTATKLNLFTWNTSFSHNWRDGAVTQYLVSFHSNFERSTATDLNRERARAEIDAQHLHPLFANLQLLSHLNVVYSPDRLPDTEQLSLGGPTSIRGFSPSEVRGDRGFYAQLTLQRPIASGALTVTPRVYGDTGVILNLDTPPGTTTRNSLTSVGAGVDLRWYNFSAKVDWAYPLDSKPTSEGRDDGRVYAAIIAAF